MRAFAHSLHVLISPTRSRPETIDRSPSTPSRSPKSRGKVNKQGHGAGSDEYGSGTGSGGSEFELHAQKERGPREDPSTAMTTWTMLGGSEKENRVVPLYPSTAEGSSTIGHAPPQIARDTNEVEPRRPLVELSTVPSASTTTTTLPHPDFPQPRDKDKPLPPLFGSTLEVPPTDKRDPSTVSSNSRSARIMDAWDPPAIIPLEGPREPESTGGRDVPEISAGKSPVDCVVPRPVPVDLGSRTGGRRRSFRPKIKLSLNRGKTVFQPRFKEQERKVPPDEQDQSRQTDSTVNGEPISTGTRTRRNARPPLKLTIQTSFTTTVDEEGLSRIESHLPVITPLQSTVPTSFQAWPSPRSGPRVGSMESESTVRAGRDGGKQTSAEPNRDESSVSVGSTDIV